MRRLFRVFLLAAVITAARGQPSRWPWPPIDGQLSGDLAPTVLPGAPDLHWQASVDQIDGDSRRVVVTVIGKGTQVRLEAEVNLVSHVAKWKLTEGRFALSEWSAAAGHFVKALGGLTLNGTVVVTGAGVLQEGQPSGEVTISMQEGSVHNLAAGWALERVSFNGAFAIDGAARTIRSVAPATLGIGTITTKRFGARNLVVQGRLQDLQTFALTSARIEIAGGDMTAAPATVALQPLHVVLDLAINRIGLQDIAALVPTAVNGARGRVDGAVRLGWSSAGGFELGQGHFVLRNDEPAEVTLKPYPGLFTRGFPNWLMNLPHWLVRHSPLPGIKDAELGKTPIQAQSLDITFSPDPDAEGRTAVIRLTGRPRGVASRTEVNLVTNVHGSLQQFVKLGTGTNFSLNLH